MTDLVQLCKCNGCDEVFVDKNPNDQPYLPTPIETRELEWMECIYDGEECWCCPNCYDDGCLVDVYENPFTDDKETL